MPLTSDVSIGGHAGFSVPLVIAVTGHRDLRADEIPQLRTIVREFLVRTRDEHSDRGLTVMSSLAEGADQLVAEEAIALGIPLVTPLPMARELYIEDFEPGESRTRFENLLASAREVFELPLVAGNTSESLRQGSDARNQQYAQLGVFLCAHCHILLALWDGKYSEEFGGTGDVVRFHHDDVPPGLAAEGSTSRLILTDDESDLVYHVVCSRDRAGGEPADGLKALSSAWFTTDESTPRTAELPIRYRQVFQRTSEFSRDAQRHRDRISEQASSLTAGGNLPPITSGARDIDHFFCIADWLAMHYQKRHLLMLRVTHLLALLMGLMYIAYSDITSARAFIIAFIVLFLLAAGIHRTSRKMGWHRKYLDYRTLAEGLRVQFYWAVAGVTSGNRSKFAHDNFLQMQDADLGWIRNVMRVAGLESNSGRTLDDAGLNYVLAEWIGDERSGQLGYYRKKAVEKISHSLRIERLGSVVLWCSVIAIGLFAFASFEMTELVRDEIIILMGVLLLLTGVSQSYSFGVADFELIKQYEFMYRTFSKARTRIQKSETDEEKRQILRHVGDASLDEHAEWLLMHRERSVSEGELWRMVGG